MDPLDWCMITSAPSPLYSSATSARLKIFPGKWGLLPDHRKRSQAKETEPLSSWLEHLNYKVLSRAVTTKTLGPWSALTGKKWTSEYGGLSVTLQGQPGRTWGMVRARWCHGGHTGQHCTEATECSSPQHRKPSVCSDGKKLAKKTLPSSPFQKQAGVLSSK